MYSDGGKRLKSVTNSWTVFHLVKHVWVTSWRITLAFSSFTASFRRQESLKYFYSTFEEIKKLKKLQVVLLIEDIPRQKKFWPSSSVSTVWAVAQPFKDFTMIYILFMHYETFPVS